MTTPGWKNWASEAPAPVEKKGRYIADMTPQPLIRLLLAAAALALAGCASLPPPQPAPRSTAPTDVAGTRLAQIAKASTPPGSGPDAPSGFQLMPEGPTALNARVALARQAQKSIDAQYYILQADGSGLLFLHELLQAARRGGLGDTRLDFVQRRGAVHLRLPGAEQVQVRPVDEEQSAIGHRCTVPMLALEWAHLPAR